MLLRSCLIMTLLAPAFAFADSDEDGVILHTVAGSNNSISEVLKGKAVLSLGGDAAREARQFLKDSSAGPIECTRELDSNDRYTTQCHTQIDLTTGEFEPLKVTTSASGNFTSGWQVTGPFCPGKESEAYLASATGAVGETIYKNLVVTETVKGLGPRKTSLKEVGDLFCSKIFNATDERYEYSCSFGLRKSGQTLSAKETMLSCILNK